MPVELQLTSVLLIYAVSALVTIGLSLYGIRQLQKSGWDETTAAFVGIVLSTSIWTVARFFELLFVSELLSRIWLTTLYVGYGGAGVSTLFFGLAFTGKRVYLRKHIVAAVLILPAIAVILAGTNPLHELFWTGEFVERSGWWGDLWIHEREFQPVFFAYMLYVVGATLAGIYMLLRMAIQSPEIYRHQTIAFAIGGLFATLMGVLFGIGAQPFVPDFVDLVPIGWGIMGLCYGYAIFRYQMLDLIPVARDTVIQSMHDGYIVLDTQNRIVDFNDAALELFEGQEEIVGEQIEDSLPESMGVLSEHEHGTQSEGEINVEIEAEQRFFLANLSSLSENDRRIGRLLLVRDITERRSVQKRYQALIENSSDLIIVTDPDGRISYVSPSVKNILGIPPEAIESEDSFSYVHEDDREAIRESYEELIENPGEKLRVEYRLPDQDGNWLYFEADLWNLLDNPVVEGIVTNAREITERKERERDLREANDQLTKANEQLEQFASVITHDLRNPINVAKGHAQIAEETGNQESFEKIEDSLNRMEAIIDDVLTLAREGETIGETEQVSLEALAQEAWGHVATDDATLEIANEATFQADPDRLLQLFENCFRNAHEHVGDDVTVTVGTADDCLYIEDDGPGIPKGKRDEIFESGHTTNQEGTGLGLSIVEGIASAHGWSVGVAAEADGGARFEFCGIDGLA